VRAFGRLNSHVVLQRQIAWNCERRVQKCIGKLAPSNSREVTVTGPGSMGRADCCPSVLWAGRGAFRGLGSRQPGDPTGREGPPMVFGPHSDLSHMDRGFQEAMKGANSLAAVVMCGLRICFSSILDMLSVPYGEETWTGIIPRCQRWQSTIHTGCPPSPATHTRTHTHTYTDPTACDTLHC